MKSNIAKTGVVLAAALMMFLGSITTARATITFDMPPPGNQIPGTPDFTPDITYTDTPDYTHYSDATGSVHAISTISGATITYGIGIGTDGAKAVDLGNGKVAYTCRYGTLQLNKANGSYIFFVSDAGINGLSGKFDPSTELPIQDTSTSIQNNIQITARDGIDTVTLNFRIQPIGFDDTPRVLAGIADQVATVGTSYSFTIPNATAFDPVDGNIIGGVFKPERLRYSFVSGAPSWLSVTNNIPFFSAGGGPNVATFSNNRPIAAGDAGIFTITLRATANDSSAYFPKSVDTSFTLTVLNPMAGLTVTLAGDGEGSVNSASAGIHCTSGSSCPAVNVAKGVTVPLSPTASTGSIFNSWNPTCPDAGNGACILPMNNDTTITATFDSLRWIRISNAPATFYGTLQSSYAAAVSGDTIQARTAGIFSGNLTFNRPNISVVLDGGKDDSWNNSGYSTVNGTIKISNGKVTASRIRVQSD